MIRTAIKGVFAHKLRLTLTAVAIVMGVAFVAGTFVLTDTINSRFSTLFDDVYAGVDATVRPESSSMTNQSGSFEVELADTIASVEGVDRIAAGVGGVAQIIAPNGDPIGGQGPPTIGSSWIDVPALTAFRIDEGNGRAPIDNGEVAIDVATSNAHDLGVGDEVRIETAAGAESFEIVGLVSFGSEDNLAGATISVFELTEAQRLFGLEGRFSQIDVLAIDGVDPETLTARLQQALPSGIEAVTGSQQTQEQFEQFTEGLGFLNTALLAFAAVAVFVGAFIIQNTFRIVVAQRTKELALLRAVGASRRQVMAMVLTEALAVGMFASALGVLVGIGFAQLLKVGMDAMGFGMPDGPLTVELRTVVVGMMVGLTVTIASSLLPAQKASRIAPVAAMRDMPPARRSLKNRALAGTGIVLLAALALGLGLATDTGNALTLVAFGSLAGFIGISVLAPLFARPIANLLGKPLPGIAGRLARGNTARQPRRTAATASALMIGVALVAFVSIFGASIKASVGDSLDGAFPADLSIRSSNFYAGVSPAATDALLDVEELDTVSEIFFGETAIEGNSAMVVAVDPATVDAVYRPDASIPMNEFGEGVLVRSDRLEASGWAIGQFVAIQYPSMQTVPTEIVGTFEDQSFAEYLITTTTYAEHFAGQSAGMVFATLSDGFDAVEGQLAAQNALGAFPSIDVNTQSDQIAEAEAQIDQMLALFSALLGLAVIIAVIGIANTLALSVVERTREIGLLRAVGMGRRQVRRMVRWESIITALFGAMLGIGVGVVLGWATVASLAEDGLGTFALPGSQLAAWLLVAAVAGVLAAIGPARKASRMRILEAIAYE
ncbi:MAG: FtsX-like permease family protein [Acidimicrobiia bacterium]|nr:FtsX-like permease family protein [Acidimicrobiia bacterium]